MNTNAIMDNILHILGIIIGKTLLKRSGLRYSREEQGEFPFDTVSANLAADGIKQVWFPHKMW